MSIVRKKWDQRNPILVFFQAKLRKILKILKFTKKMVKHNFETKANQKFTRSFRNILVPNFKKKKIKKKDFAHFREKLLESSITY